MKTVHKFPLRSRGRVASLMLPKGAMITKIDKQHGSPFVWVLVDTNAPYDQQCDILILGTGSDAPVDEGFWPMHTFFEGEDNHLVWHAYVKWHTNPQPSNAVDFTHVA